MILLYIGWSNTWRWKVECGFQGLGEGGTGKSLLNSISFIFARWKEFCRWMVVMVHNSVSVLNATELNIIKFTIMIIFVMCILPQLKYCNLNIAADPKILQLNMKVIVEMYRISLYKYDCFLRFLEEGLRGWVEDD